MSIPIFAIRAARRMLAGLLLVVAALTMAIIVLAGVIPAVSGGSTLAVRGGSMDPAIPLGSALIVTPVGAAGLRAGDVVTVQVGPDTAVFTHRITRVIPRTDGIWLQTQGDANATPDPSPIPATAVIGRATFWIPVVGNLFSELASPLGMALIVSSALSLLACDWFLEALEDEYRLRARRPAFGGAHGADPLAGSTVTI
jgi:signal peptidase